MSFLRGKRAYLSGPIEKCNAAVNWRPDVIKALTEKFGIDVFDPFADPKQQWVPALNVARKEGDFVTMRKIAKSFVRKDLGMVDRSDMVIAYLPENVPTTGTHHEIISANNSKKPTLLVTNRESVAYIPLWYFGFVPVEFMFAGWDSLYEYLSKIDAGNTTNDRWDIVREVV